MAEASRENTDTSIYSVVLWIWTFIVTVVTAIVFGNIFPADAAEGATGGFYITTALGGAVVGLFSTLPLWVLYALGRQILHNVAKLRADVAKAQG